MGGTVGVTIIRENGEVIKMARKTGSYSSLFLSKAFNEGDYDKAINDYIQAFLEMKEDYETGEPFKYPMSPIYGFFNETSPIDYGLVVIDFKNKKIHSMQEYDIVGSILPNVFSPFLVLGKTEHKNLKHLFDNNLINVYLRGNDHDYINVSKFEKLGTFQDIYENINLDEVKSKKDTSYFSTLVNSISKKIFKNPLVNNKLNPEQINENVIFFPKELEKFVQISYSFNDDFENTLNFFTQLTNDGFTFNQTEIKSWENHLENKLENLEIEYLDDLSNEEYETLLKQEKDKIREKFKKTWNNNKIKVKKTFNP